MNKLPSCTIIGTFLYHLAATEEMNVPINVLDKFDQLLFSFIESGEYYSDYSKDALISFAQDYERFCKIENETIFVSEDCDVEALTRWFVNSLPVEVAEAAIRAFHSLF